jgi:hypothetical protein
LVLAGWSRRRYILAPAVFYAMDPFAGPRYSGPPSDHFDGEAFHNVAPVELHGFADLIRWVRTREPGYWPEWINAQPSPPPPAEVPGLRIALIGHSSVLVQADGLNILTDPQWSERASPVSWAGSKRRPNGHAGAGFANGPDRPDARRPGGGAG